MKKYFKKVIIPIEIYNTGIHIIVSNNYERVKKFLENHFKEKFEYINDENETDAYCIFEKSVWCVIYMKKYCDYALTHEIFHSVYRIMDNAGISLNSDTTEAFAYLMEYIYKKAINLLK